MDNKFNGIILRAELDDGLPHALEHFEAARAALRAPAVRQALLAELACLMQRKASTPLVNITPDVLQQLAYADGLASQVQMLLSGIFQAEEELISRNSAATSRNQE